MFSTYILCAGHVHQILVNMLYCWTGCMPEQPDICLAHSAQTQDAIRAQKFSDLWRGDVLVLA
jgi:hypothetical protein